VGENLQSKFLPRGHVVFNEGDLGDYMYFINSGTVEVSTKDGFRAKLGQGDSFGAGSLIRPGALRSATIRCITPLHVIRIDKAYFNKYVASSETEIAFKLREKVNKNNFGRAEFILGKQSNLTDVYFDKGDCIFKKGEDADSMYTVDEGEVDVRVAGMTVYTLKSGDTFGVQGLLMGRPRRASAFCVSDHCKLRSMDVDDFKRLLESSPELKQSLREMALRREFRRAMVLKTRKAFPDVHELKAVFDEVDLNGSGDICVYELKEVLRHLEKSLSDDEILELIRSMDLNNSGSINFSEFQSIFGRN
jgi:CRP-like cAMP-binding protein